MKIVKNYLECDPHVCEPSLYVPCQKSSSNWKYKKIFTIFFPIFTIFFQFNDFFQIDDSFPFDIFPNFLQYDTFFAMYVTIFFDFFQFGDFYYIFSHLANFLNKKNRQFLFSISRICTYPEPQFWRNFLWVLGNIKSGENRFRGESFGKKRQNKVTLYLSIWRFFQKIFSFKILK